MGNISEIIFREDMAAQNAAEYIDDLDCGRPLGSVAYDYAREQITKAVGALVCLHGWWERTGADTARLNIELDKVELMRKEISQMVSGVASYRLGPTFRTVDKDDE